MTETEVERLVVRLNGDASSYNKMFNDAQTTASNAAQNIGRSTVEIEARLKGITKGTAESLGDARSAIAAFANVTTTALTAVGASADKLGVSKAFKEINASALSAATTVSAVSESMNSSWEYIKSGMEKVQVTATTLFSITKNKLAEIAEGIGHVANLVKGVLVNAFVAAGNAAASLAAYILSITWAGVIAGAKAAALAVAEFTAGLATSSLFLATAGVAALAAGFIYLVHAIRGSSDAWKSLDDSITKSQGLQTKYLTMLRGEFEQTMEKGERFDAVWERKEYYEEQEAILKERVKAAENEVIKAQWQAAKASSYALPFTKERFEFPTTSLLNAIGIRTPEQTATGDYLKDKQATLNLLAEQLDKMSQKTRDVADVGKVIDEIMKTLDKMGEGRGLDAFEKMVESVRRAAGQARDLRLVQFLITGIKSIDFATEVKKTTAAIREQADAIGDLSHANREEAESVKIAMMERRLAVNEQRGYAQIALMKGIRGLDVEQPYHDPDHPFFALRGSAPSLGAALGGTALSLARDVRGKLEQQLSDIASKTTIAMHDIDDQRAALGKTKEEFQIYLNVKLEGRLRDLANTTELETLKINEMRKSVAAGTTIFEIHNEVIERARLKLLNYTDAQIEMAIKVYNGNKAISDRAKLFQEGEILGAHLQTPDERKTEALKKYDKMLKENAITPETYRRALLALEHQITHTSHAADNAVRAGSLQHALIMDDYVKWLATFNRTVQENIGEKGGGLGGILGLAAGVLGDSETAADTARGAAKRGVEGVPAGADKGINLPAWAKPFLQVGEAKEGFDFVKNKQEVEADRAGAAARADTAEAALRAVRAMHPFTGGLPSSEHPMGFEIGGGGLSQDVADAAKKAGVGFGFGAGAIGSIGQAIDAIKSGRADWVKQVLGAAMEGAIPVEGAPIVNPSDFLPPNVPTKSPASDLIKAQMGIDVSSTGDLSKNTDEEQVALLKDIRDNTKMQQSRPMVDIDFAGLA